MKYLRTKNIQEKYSISRSTTRKLVREFETEIQKSDSKIKQNNLIKVSNMTLVEEEAFQYFIENRDMLIDKAARKRVPDYLDSKAKAV